MKKNDKCYTYCPQILNTITGSDGFWKIYWKYLQCPAPGFHFISGLFGTKKGIYEQAKIQAFEQFIIFSCDRGEVAIPNDIVSLEVLEDLIKYARSIQKPYNEDERLSKVKYAKKYGYINDKDYSQFDCERSPFDKDYSPHSMINEYRLSHEALRRKKTKKKSSTKS